MRSAPEIIYQFVDLAHRARKDGMLSLKPALHALDDPFIAKGLQMTIDGVDLAVAIITTFYGAVLNKMLFLPMNGKLRNRSAEEMVLQGVLGIARGDNPMVLEQKLHSFVPASLRVSAFE